MQILWIICGSWSLAFFATDTPALEEYFVVSWDDDWVTCIIKEAVILITTVYLKTLYTDYIIYPS